jgi:hypothetical protein
MTATLYIRFCKKPEQFNDGVDKKILDQFSTNNSCIDKIELLHKEQHIGRALQPTFYKMFLLLQV